MNVFERIPSNGLTVATVILSLVTISWLGYIVGYLRAQHGLAYVLSAVLTGIVPACTIVYVMKYSGVVRERLKRRQLVSLIHSSIGEPIRVVNSYGVLQAVASASKGSDICINYLPVSQNPASIVPVSKVFSIKWSDVYSSLDSELKNLLEANKISILDTFGIEYKSVAAVFECHAEIKWLNESIHQLKSLEEAMRVSIDKASGNRLLESAISRLKTEKERYATQLIELDNAYNDVKRMLKELIDYLEMPEAARNILGLDLQLYQRDNTRFERVRESFNEVVEMSTALNELSHYTM